jgi:transposase
MGNPPDTPEWNLLAAQLYNAGFAADKIANAFNRATSTLRRWGLALKNGAIDSVLKARSGAPTRLTPEIERFVRMRFRQIYRDTRDYNVTIRAEVERVFEQVFSSEILRLFFAKERNLIANELAAGETCDVRPAPATSPGDLPPEPAATEPTEAALADTASDSPCLPGPATTTKISAPEELSRPITCETPLVSRSDLAPARKYSLWRPSFLDLADGESTLCHFAGLLLMAPKIRRLPRCLARARCLGRRPATVAPAALPVIKWGDES